MEAVPHLESCKKDLRNSAQNIILLTPNGTPVSTAEDKMDVLSEHSIVTVPIKTKVRRITLSSAMAAGLLSLLARKPHAKAHRQ